MSPRVGEADSSAWCWALCDHRQLLVSNTLNLALLPFPHNVLLDVISGPFSNQEMAEWFQAGYFTMSLLVKRACDETFQPLGDIMKMWGRVPFTPGPAPLPHLVIT